jgi:hypothetical protein
VTATWSQRYSAFCTPPRLVTSVNNCE